MAKIGRSVGQGHLPFCLTQHLLRTGHLLLWNPHPGLFVRMHILRPLLSYIRHLSDKGVAARRAILTDSHRLPFIVMICAYV